MSKERQVSEEVVQALVDRAIVGRDREIMLLLAGGRTMKSVSRLYGLTHERIRQIRNSIYSDWPELEMIIGSVRYSNRERNTKSDLAAMRTRDRSRINDFLVVHQGAWAEWTPELAGKLGLELLAASGISLEGMTPIGIASTLLDVYGLRFLGSHIFCQRCRQIKPSPDFGPAIRSGRYGAGFSRVCRACNTERRRSYYDRVEKYKRVGLTPPPDPTSAESRKNWEEYMKANTSNYIIPERRTIRARLAAMKRWHEDWTFNQSAPDPKS